MPSTEIYASPQEIRNAFSGVSNDDDGLLTAYASSASRMIDGFMGRKETGFQAIQTATTREYTGKGERYLFIDECIEITAVKLKDALTDATYDKVLAATEYKAFRGSYSDPNFNDKPYTGILLTSNATIGTFYTGYALPFFTWEDYPDKDALEPTVQITARWGYSDTVPEVIRQATIFQAIEIYKIAQGGMANVTMNDNFGKAIWSKKLHPKVEMLLKLSGIKRANFAGR